MTKRRKIEEMAADLYDDQDVAAAVVEDARKLANVEKIEAGELVLPHPQDAHRWHQERTQKEERVQQETALQAEVRTLRDRLNRLEGGG